MSKLSTLDVENKKIDSQRRGLRTQVVDMAVGDAQARVAYNFKHYVTSGWVASLSLAPTNDSTH